MYPPLHKILRCRICFLIKKNVPWHILAPRRGCFGNHLPLRRVRILAERFCSKRSAAKPSPQAQTISASQSLSLDISLRRFRSPYRFQDQSLRGSPSLSLRQPGSFFDRVYSRYNLRCTPSSSQDLLPWSYMPPDTLHRKEPAKSGASDMLRHIFHMPCRLPYRQLLRRLRHGLRRRDMPLRSYRNRYNHNHRISDLRLGQRKASHSRRFHDTHNLSSPYRRFPDRLQMQPFSSLFPLLRP